MGESEPVILPVPHLRLKREGNTVAYGPRENGPEAWEIVTVEFGQGERPFPVEVLGNLFYENKMAKHGAWLTTREVAALLQVWAKFLRPGDQLVVRSYKDRGVRPRPKDPYNEWPNYSADVTDGYEVIDG